MQINCNRSSSALRHDADTWMRPGVLLYGRCGKCHTQNEGVTGFRWRGQVGKRCAEPIRNSTVRSMNESIIEVESLDFTYNGQLVLENINLAINTGDFVAMIGPNGGGKTTLLKLLLGLLTPRSGSVQVFGRNPKEVTHRIGYVPQNIHFNQRFPISAQDVVLMGLLKPGRQWSRYTKADRIAAQGALEKMEMAAKGRRRIGELSGGQRQRVFIARALVTEPDILILDEPTASIDSKGQHEFYELLHALSRDITIVLASHDLMVLSRYVKSVACVNRNLHYHDQGEISEKMIESMYRCSIDESCPVELIAHGIPHRVLKKHP